MELRLDRVLDSHERYGTNSSERLAISEYFIGLRGALAASSVIRSRCHCALIMVGKIMVVRFPTKVLVALFFILIVPI